MLTAIPSALLVSLPLVASQSSEQASLELLVSASRFGTASAVSGDTVIVGGRNAIGEEMAFVFARTENAWTLEPEWLASPNAVLWRGFGTAVAIDGDTVVVGASIESSQTGAAYVFVRAGGTWSQQARLEADDAQRGDQFGDRVAISGETIAIAASWEAASSSNSGSVYVFERSGTTWSQQQKLKASDPTNVRRLGESLDLDGDTLVAGSPRGNGPFFNSGKAFVFARVGSTWTETQKLQPSDPAGGHSFGRSVAVEGNTVVVGASGDNQARGACYIFGHDGSSWNEVQKLVSSNAAPADSFGYAAALSGDSLVIGAYRYSSSSPKPGTAYAFVREGTTWTEQQQFLPTTSMPGDLFGREVAIDGDTAVVGSQTGAFVFSTSSASTTTRSSGQNPTSYVSSKPVIGAAWTAQVDLSLTGHSHAQVLGYSAPATQSLPGGQVLLLGGPRVFSTPLAAGPLASWNFMLPNDPMLAGFTVSTQAVHILGATPFALSNAEDLQLGY